MTLEYKINFTRPMSADTGIVRGEGKTLHVGRQMAIGEGRLLDAKGRLQHQQPEGRSNASHISLRMWETDFS